LRQTEVSFPVFLAGYNILLSIVLAVTQLHTCIYTYSNSYNVNV